MTLLNKLGTMSENDKNFAASILEARNLFRRNVRDETNELLPRFEKVLQQDQIHGLTKQYEGSCTPSPLTMHLPESSKPAVVHTSPAPVMTQANASHSVAESSVTKGQHAASKTAEQSPPLHEIADTVSSSASIAQDMVASVTPVLREAVAPATTGFIFWDMWLRMRSGSFAQSRPVTSRQHQAQIRGLDEEIIPIGEEVLTVGVQKVPTGKVRIERFVVETPVEEKINLVSERVVVERRRPMHNVATGEILTELTIEVVETTEIPVVEKRLHVKEEIVVRTERTERVQTVRETVRQDRIKVDHIDAGVSARQLQNSADR